MSTALQKLDFMISLIDRVSGPAGKVMKTMDTMTTKIQSGYRQIGYGAAGVAGVGYSLESLIEPAKSLRTAIGTIESLGVEDSALASLRRQSYKTAVKYGEDAESIITSSYKLQSAISSIKGNELSMLIDKSTLLATATKGSLDSTNAYVGQMFNINEAEANAVGKTAFMDKLVSKTAKAVQLFNTDGEKMGEAMKNIGKQATAMKIPLDEQLAVMGFLQNTMIEGSRSGTAYLSFLSNIHKAESVLGMKFTNSQDAVLPMVEIISKLESQFGDLSKASDQALLQKAFGKRGQQVLSAMAGSMGTFVGNLEQINSVDGLADVIAMANSITDPWDKAASGVRNLRVEFGEKLLVYLLPFYDETVKITDKLMRWMDLFPNLTALIAESTLWVLGIIAAISALSIAVGVSKFLLVGVNIILGVVSFAFKGLMFTILKVIPAVWSFSSALLANPITWVVLGITALIAAVVAAVVYWDVWTGKIIEWGGKFLEFVGLFSLVDGVLAAWDALPQWWSSFKDWIGTLDPFAFIGDSIDWIVSKINLIPGISIGDAPKPPKPLSNTAASNNAQIASQGGTTQRISSAIQNKRTDIGGLTVNNYGPSVNGQTLWDEILMAGG